MYAEAIVLQAKLVIQPLIQPAFPKWLLLPPLTTGSGLSAQHPWSFGSHAMCKTPSILQTTQPSGSAQEETSLGLTWESSLGSQGGGHSFSWPGLWLPLLSHLPLLLTRSSCRGMPARNSTSAFAVSNTSPEMVSKRKSPHELECGPRKKKK